jgi:RNA polymerase sigma-70 factor (ECF subfamily)
MAAMDFNELYDRYFNKVYNYVRYHVRLADEADDITGKVFEAVLNRFETYDEGKGPVHAWLFTIARNAVIDWARARDKRREVPLEDVSERAGGEPGAQSLLEGKEEAGLLLEAVGELDDRARDIIALKFNSGLTNRDIALMTGMGESNVGIVIYRAVKKMQAFVEGRKKI